LRIDHLLRPKLAKQKAHSVVHHNMYWSYAGLTRVSIDLHKDHFSKEMDCRVKPGNDEGCGQRQFCNLTPNITTVEAELDSGMLESRISRRRLPLTQRLRVSL
jgi:hypothetical protein